MTKLSDHQKRQLEFLRTIETFTSTLFLMGGFAEDAVLFSSFSRDHEDIDLIVKRADLEKSLSQLALLGYTQWETWGQTASGEPFYLSKQVNGLLLDIGVTDSDIQGTDFLEIGQLSFDLGGARAPAGYRVYLPADTYNYPPVPFEDIHVHTISPLANFQIRAGIASQGSFGQLRPKDIMSKQHLKARFFPNTDEKDLLPKIEKIC